MHPDAINELNKTHDTRAYETAKASAFVAAREMTVGEILDHRIMEAERTLRCLHGMKSALSGDFLNCNGSRISPLLKG